MAKDTGFFTPKDIPGLQSTFGNDGVNAAKNTPPELNQNPDMGLLNTVPELNTPTIKAPVIEAPKTPKPAPKPQPKPINLKHHLFARIANRNAIASETLADRNPLARAFAKTQLQVGNAIDATYTGISNPLVKGVFGATMGALRGSFVGIIGFLIAAAAISNPVTIVPALILGASVIGFTAYEGLKGYNDGMISNHKGMKIADTIAMKVGAAPTNGQKPPALSTYLPTPDMNKVSWTEIEARRRELARAGIKEHTKNHIPGRHNGMSM